MPTLGCGGGREASRFRRGPDHQAQLVKRQMYGRPKLDLLEARLIGDMLTVIKCASEPLLYADEGSRLDAYLQRFVIDGCNA